MNTQAGTQVKLGPAFPAVGYNDVQHTQDFDRIARLPRRTPVFDDAVAWADALTPSVVVPGSIAALRPWQGYALAESIDDPIEGRTDIGAVLNLPVGVGKTIISYTLPVLTDARRPVLVLPAALRDKTWADFASYHGKWRKPRNAIRLLSREELALERNCTLLEDYAPDLIVIDEADDLANFDSAAVRRLHRFIMRGGVPGNPDVRVVAMTGTLGRNSILDYWHLMIWCLRETAPVPLSRSEAELWAAAIDNKVRNPRRPGPGPLGPNIQAAREWYRRRVYETPGVLIVDGDSCTAPLTIRTRLAKEDGKLDAAFEMLLLEEQNPGGIQVTDSLSRWLLDGQIGCGLYTVYDPPPPEPWRIARRAEAKFVRDHIRSSARSREPLDTEKQVLRKYATHPIVRQWQDVKGTYKPRTKAVWLSASTIESALEWLESSPAPGIVWCGSVDFAERLARASGLTYYARQGKSQSGLGLHVAPLDRSLIASWNANKKGFNLQNWTRQLLVMPPQSAKWLEQIFGRSHRSGQESPVTVEFLLTSGGTIDLFETAIAEAKFNKETLTLTQKILRAKIERARPKVTERNQYRWASRTKEE